MTDRDEKILRAAKELFSRYGVSKTTMNDIAAEAGVARQTVYNAFPNKPEILRATTRLAMQDFQAYITDAWDTADGAAAKIDAFLELGPLSWYEMMMSSPAIAELFDGINQHASKETAQASKEWKHMIAKMLESEGYTSNDPDVSMSDIADFFYFSSLNAKHSVDSADMLRARLRTIKSALFGLLQQT